MPTVKILHTLRDVVGTPELTVEGDTVKQVLKALTRDYGDEFKRRLDASKVTVNGLNVIGLCGVGTKLSESDVVALIPPMLPAKDE